MKRSNKSALIYGAMFLGIGILITIFVLNSQFVSQDSNSEPSIISSDGVDRKKQIEIDSDDDTIDYQPVVDDSTPALESPLRIADLASNLEGIKVTWDVPYGTNMPNGFKVVYSQSQNPIYPEDGSEDIPDSDSREVLLDITDGEMYYIKVCRYIESEDICDLYSSESSIVALKEISDPIDTPEDNTDLDEFNQ